MYKLNKEIVIYPMTSYKQPALPFCRRHHVGLKDQHGKVGFDFLEKGEYWEDEMYDE